MMSKFCEHNCKNHAFFFYRDFFFKYDIPCSHDINTVHFFPDGGEKGREDELKVKKFI